MCSIYVSSIKSSSYRRVNKLLRLRGPDNTNIIRLERFALMHNLLSMTGAFCVQPFVQGDVLCLYNGEIYNYQSFGKYKSDGECLIDLYQAHGPAFTRQLDGEFAICLCDFKKRRIVISSDIFKTKPIFYSAANGEFGCSSFRSPLEEGGHKEVAAMPANRTKVYDMDSLKLLEEFSVYDFNLKQFKTTFDGWDAAFQAAIRKRAAGVREKVFMGLSSGYDSGVICLELLRTGIPFEAYSVLGNENDEVIEQRFHLIEKSANSIYRTFRKTRWQHKINRWFVRRHTDPFQYTIRSSFSDYTETIPLTDDGGSIWLSHVCRQGRRAGGASIFLVWARTRFLRITATAGQNSQSIVILAAYFQKTSQRFFRG